MAVFARFFVLAANENGHIIQIFVPKISKISSWSVILIAGQFQRLRGRFVNSFQFDFDVIRFN